MPLANELLAGFDLQLQLGEELLVKVLLTGDLDEGVAGAIWYLLRGLGPGGAHWKDCGGGWRGWGFIVFGA